MTGVLKNVRVLDMGRYVAGPYCATLLGYLGADVVRVERPGGGEDRFIAPLHDDDGGSVLMQTGCNKRSLCLNLRHADSREILDRLACRADVVVANLPRKFLESIGYGYERLSRLNPGVVLATQTAFGGEGPWSDRGGFDGVGQAMSGAAFMTGTEGKPAKAAAPYVDFCTATLSAVGVLAALIERQQSGKGQHVEGSLLGTALAVFNSHLIEQSGLDLNRKPTGNRVQTSAPSDVFATQDGHVLMHVVGAGLFRKLAALLEADDWLSDEGLATDQARGDRRDQLCERVADWCAVRTTDSVLDACAQAGVPAGPVLSLAESLGHPQTQALNLMKEVGYPGRDFGVSVADLPINLSRTPGGIQRQPPVAGADTEAVLQELGFTPEEIAAFSANGVT